MCVHGRMELRVILTRLVCTFATCIEPSSPINCFIIDSILSTLVATSVRLSLRLSSTFAILFHKQSVENPVNIPDIILDEIAPHGISFLYVPGKRKYVTNTLIDAAMHAWVHPNNVRCCSLKGNRYPQINSAMIDGILFYCN